MAAEEETSHNWDGAGDFPGEESLAVSDEDAVPVVHNVVITWKECFSLSDPNKSTVSAGFVSLNIF